MWKIWIFLLLKIISALTINNEVITTSKSQASQSQDIIISPQGKYVFMQTPTITFSRNFENQGTFSVSTEQLQKLSLKFQYTSGKFLNKGTFTAITSDMAQATEFLIKVNQFTNEDNGYMKIESGSRSGTQNSLIEASSLKNKGIIIIKNQGVNRGTFQINLKTTSGIGGSWGSTKPAVEFSNAGTIELYFQNFKQGNWPIVGGGCIYLENKSLLELDTNNAANLQTFVFGEQSTIVINNSVKNFSFKFMNFAPGNIIQSKYLLRFSYRSDTGIVEYFHPERYHISNQNQNK
ncbi:uncharacterized protein SPAPADRAFT_51216 [Spathaspora passalidarum NRRL Y-27907]|uniref:Hyphally-regulated cell wall protein N-terminal domain-containing protein n=1 Tax=Spathaspora passalidarum (strain NRRL Y-27907 / 11-Y1) TaxID=619300 RepID=G3APG6_SPAPN|nr:uncharacterized protein SPAPADRAFT_51216 [Spathaspora passalidarum NRRL Y-27907]EGW32683.1 hypothetical protein SPAPADRAFT_51216 [Spathaspora passalidarum NRRL Y-27907]